MSSHDHLSCCLGPRDCIYKQTELTKAYNTMKYTIKILKEQKLVEQSSLEIKPSEIKKLDNR